jgi:hypothetical protein
MHQEPTRKPAPTLIPASRVRELFARHDPGYGKDFDEAEWERIAERLSALARLLWRFSVRLATEESNPPRSAQDRPGSEAPAQET